MLSIGIFTYSTKPRGSVVHAACLAEALQRKGARATLYALSNQMATATGTVTMSAMADAPAGRWSEAQAKAWGEKMPWLVGLATSELDQRKSSKPGTVRSLSSSGREAA